jgi:branched-chain amino acid transport system permease protein
VPAEIYLNVAVSGLLTGLVYGLMALGLSVIFGVVRVVNFAHGEMMTLAMYLAVVLFAALKLDPLLMMQPIAAVLFGLGYALQIGLINPFIARPEHSQFMLLVAVAIILVNGLLIGFGPDARNVQTAYAFDSFAIGPLIVDATKTYAGGAAVAASAALFAFSNSRHSARQSVPAPTTIPVRWWLVLMSTASTRSPLGSARPAPEPPAPYWC